MTSPKVSQEAREAAATWAKSNSRHQQAANIKRGSCDTGPLVQSFAQFEQLIRSMVIDEAAGVADRFVDRNDASELGYDLNAQAEGIASSIRQLGERGR